MLPGWHVDGVGLIDGGILFQHFHAVEPDGDFGCLTRLSRSFHPELPARRVVDIKNRRAAILRIPLTAIEKRAQSGTCGRERAVCVNGERGVGQCTPTLHRRRERQICRDTRDGGNGGREVARLERHDLRHCSNGRKVIIQVFRLDVGVPPPTHAAAHAAAKQRPPERIVDMNPVGVERAEFATAGAEAKFAGQGGLVEVAEKVADAVGEYPFHIRRIDVKMCLGKINIGLVPEVGVVVFVCVTGGNQVVVRVNIFQKSRHFEMPRGHVGFSLLELVGPVYLVEEFPCHDSSGIAPARHDVAQAVFEVAFGRRVGEKIPSILARPAVEGIVRIVVPLWVYLGGHLTVVVQAEHEVHPVFGAKIKQPILIVAARLLVFAQPGVATRTVLPFDAQPPRALPHSEKIAAIVAEFRQPIFEIEVWIAILPTHVFADGDVLVAIVKMQIVGLVGAYKTLVVQTVGGIALKCLLRKRASPGRVGARKRVFPRPRFVGRKTDFEHTVPHRCEVAGLGVELVVLHKKAVHRARLAVGSGENSAHPDIVIIVRIEKIGRQRKCRLEFAKLLDLGRDGRDGIDDRGLAIGMKSKKERRRLNHSAVDVFHAKYNFCRKQNTSVCTRVRQGFLSKCRGDFEQSRVLWENNLPCRKKRASIPLLRFQNRLVWVEIFEYPARQSAATTWRNTTLFVPPKRRMCIFVNDFSQK